MSSDKIESIMQQSAHSLELEWQKPDAQTIAWCRQLLACEISLEEYLNWVIHRAMG